MYDRGVFPSNSTLQSIHSSPAEQSVYEKLLWIECRRQRIVGAIRSHLSVPRTEQALARLGPLENYLETPLLVSRIDESGPRSSLARLAFQIQKQEAATIEALRLEFQSEAEFFRTETLAGARLAGQEAARSYQARTSQNDLRDLTLVFAALDNLTYFGLPWDRRWFSSVRPLADIAININSSAHLNAWVAAGADLDILCDIQNEWIDGVLDIIAPNIVHVCSAQIERGHAFGRHRFIPREKFVSI